MQQHKMQRRMVVVLHIKIHGQIIKGILFPHRDIVPKLLPRNPHRLLIDISLIAQKPAVAPVSNHILHHGGKIAQGFPQTVPVDLIVDKLRQTPLRLGGHNPGIILRVRQLKAEQLIHVKALFSGDKKGKYHETQRHSHYFRTYFMPVCPSLHSGFHPPRAHPTS